MYDEYENKMKKTIEVLQGNYTTVRAGRANPSILDQVKVDYYGTPTPINQIAGISTPDPRTLMISPWDANSLKPIEKAIMSSDLGINPANDGRVIRLQFPQPTEENPISATTAIKPKSLLVNFINDLHIFYKSYLIHSI